MPAWLQLMLDSFWPLLKAGLVFTVPLTLITFIAGTSLGFWRCSLYVLLTIFTPPDNQDFALLGSWL